ncbi:conserved hypothetical protein [Nitrosococcus halophilus Nc 4]|uniref:DnaJ homologue subfamily C member 28 conserved domain-containing protein n=1 Tax=Nitrosococcus halophilus (strain Nc4) TaxID=472759 RepID=D5BXW0_NITHN|nr:DnaJ family domain-containing protein [Nitrosococcus halophilus]ADE15871.1 conserved hypothetical protein [Nitrosococcus halophilus Nc 4]
MIAMLLLEKIAEARIAEAIERGELDNLPGQGRPLRLDDDRLVPESLRAAYRILKNAGYLPPELEPRREIRTIEQLLATTEDETERREARKKLSYLLGKIAALRGTSSHLQTEQYYYEKLMQRLQEGNKDE